MKIIVCRTCGSEDVYADAYAQWNSKSQQWELANVFGFNYCASCEGDCSIEIIEKPDENDKRNKDQQF